MDQRYTDDRREQRGSHWGRRVAAGGGALLLGYAAVFGAVFGGMVAANCLFDCAPPSNRSLITGGSLILAAAVAGAGAAMLAVLAMGRRHWRRPAAGVGIALCVAASMLMTILGLRG